MAARARVGMVMIVMRRLTAFICKCPHQREYKDKEKGPQPEDIWDSNRRWANGCCRL